MLNVEDVKKRLVSQAKSGLTLALVSALIIVLSLTLADANQAGLLVGFGLFGFGITVFVLANRKLNKICRK